MIHIAEQRYMATQLFRYRGQSPKTPRGIKLVKNEKKVERKPAQLTLNVPRMILNTDAPPTATITITSNLMGMNDPRQSTSLNIRSPRLRIPRLHDDHVSAIAAFGK